MKKLRVHITPGMIRMSSIRMNVRNRDAIYLDVDCNSKYYAHSATESDKLITIRLRGCKSEGLAGGRETLRMSKRKNPTQIIIEKPSPDWRVFIDPPEVSKYSLRIILMRDKRAVAYHGLNNSKPQTIEL